MTTESLRAAATEAQRQQGLNVIGWRFDWWRKVTPESVLAMLDVVEAIREDHYRDPSPPHGVASMCSCGWNVTEGDDVDVLECPAMRALEALEVP